MNHIIPNSIKKMNGELFCCFSLGGNILCRLISSWSSFFDAQSASTTILRSLLLSFFLVCGTAVHSFSSGSATSIFLRVQHGSNLGECCCRILVTSWKHADVCRDDRSSNSRRNGGRKKIREKIDKTVVLHG